MMPRDSLSRHAAHAILRAATPRRHADSSSPPILIIITAIEAFEANVVLPKNFISRMAMNISAGRHKKISRDDGCTDKAPRQSLKMQIATTVDSNAFEIHYISSGLKSTSAGEYRFDFAVASDVPRYPLIFRHAACLISADDSTPPASFRSPG